ncbi:response regulator receiver domain-containing protein [Arcticibacter tournemirensis]|uniref:response regulator transcription factor n=1 Tax=Arcticibacter tournemirensis TaxID=699437 RepID=UPI0011748C30|nr:response regulator [Arcticibacter tournemirensis]TQM51378.1 response regulator receiver domain-containing protein [Arcticibacter tournemirensis]
MKTIPKKILAVDDNPAILDALNDILSFEGYEVVTLSDGSFIFEAIAESHPDLILLDVMLDNLDGRDICHAIKDDRNTNHIPVILISATHNLQDTLKNEGAPNDFIAKPFDIDFLLTKIDTQLRHAA